MSLKISNSSLFTKRYIILDSGGICYYDSSAFGSKRVPFARIDCILLSPDKKLSLQIGNEIFSITVKPQNPKHKALIDVLLLEVRRSAGLGNAAVQSPR